MTELFSHFRGENVVLTAGRVLGLGCRDEEVSGHHADRCSTSQIHVIWMS